MADLRLDILVLPTHNSQTLAIADASAYPNDPPEVIAPSINITPPGFDPVELPFVPNNYSVFTSHSLGITDPSSDLQPLPDGIYSYTYSVSPATEFYVSRNAMRIDAIQEKFDTAFLTLEMMECDRAIKAQAKIDLNSIYLFIQGSVAAANNCAITESIKLYNQANKMLDRFISGGCGCN